MRRDAVLLHVGPHKTGTTTVQRALYAGRTRLADAGVLLPVESAHPRPAFRAGTGAPGLRGDAPPEPEQWEALTARIRDAAGQRVVVSSEMCSDATPDRLPHVVDQLGGDRVHVVVTLRSQWQEHLQNRKTIRYQEWLDKVLTEPDTKFAQGFWRRHAHDRVVARWVDVVGPERVTVIVGDENDPRFLLASLEALLEVPEGTLRAGGNTNRSMTLGEAELVRLVNAEVNRRGWSDTKYAEVVRRGLCRRLTSRPPRPGDPRLVTPQWVLEEAAARQERAAAGILASGATVIGDPRPHPPEPAFDAAAAEAGPDAEPATEVDAVAAVCDLIAALTLDDVEAGQPAPAPASSALRAVASRARRRLRRFRASSGSPAPDAER
jgi:hypothetical protein